MQDIEFSKEQRTAMVDKLQRYFEDELDQELGGFDAEFLLDFFAKEVGGHFYNQGLKDARLVLDAKIALIDDELYALEKDML